MDQYCREGDRSYLFSESKRATGRFCLMCISCDDYMGCPIRAAFNNARTHGNMSLIRLPEVNVALTYDGTKIVCNKRKV